MWLLLLFIVVPVLEIWLFIIIGGAIGTYITLSIILRASLNLEADRTVLCFIVEDKADPKSLI